LVEIEVEGEIREKGREEKISSMFLAHSWVVCEPHLEAKLFKNCRKCQKCSKRGPNFPAPVVFFSRLIAPYNLISTGKPPAVNHGIFHGVFDGISTV
jgi:hypothetical protein